MDEYNSLIQSTKFKEIEVFSSEWQALHQATMEEYRKNWVADPLHWWSRQYEYPYHIEHISNFLKGCPQGVEILDVGTGTSFMPWWLLNKFPGLRLTALDIDPANGRYHKEINDRYVAAGKNNMKTDFVLVRLCLSLRGPPA
jgi:methylase of polypeptide subunit release factors